MVFRECEGARAQRRGGGIIRQIMSQLTRRQVLKSAAAVAAVSLLPDMAAGAQQAAARSSKTVCFYQFDQFAIDSLTQPNGLPTGSAFNYVFVNSSPGVRASTELGAM